MLLSTEAEAYLLLERLRWGDAPQTCPLCGRDGRCYFLHPADGSARATRTGTATQRRVWKCGSCRRQFSVLAGTVFEGSQVGVLTWIRFVADLADGRMPATAAARAGRYGVTSETARQMTRRLRRCAETEPALESLLVNAEG